MSIVASLPALGQETAAHRLDRLPFKRLHLFILVVTSAGLLFDTLEASMSNVLAAVFTLRPGVHHAEIMLMLAALYAGGVLGTPVAGLVADRAGRRMTLVAASVGYALASIAAALAPDLRQLAVARFLCGVFLSPFLPLMWTYLADVLPPARRGRLMMLGSAGGALGTPLAPMLSRALSGSPVFGLQGWQATLALGGVGGLVIAALTLLLPESPRWLEKRGRSEAAEAAVARFERSLPLLRSSGASGLVPPLPPAASQASGGEGFRRRLSLLLSLQLLQPIAVVGFVQLSSVVLVQRGIDLRSSLLYIGVASLGAPIGAVLASLVADRIPRHVAFASCALVMSVAGLAFGLIGSPEAAMGFGLLYTVVIVLFVTTLNIYGAEMFATQVRGLAAGLGFAANRLGGLLVPVVLLPILLRTNGGVMFGIIAVVLMISAALVMLFGPRGLTGRALR